MVKRYLVLAYPHENCLQGFLRKRGRRKGGVEGYPVTFEQMERKLDTVGLRKVKCFPLLTRISETIIVLARKKNDENSDGK